MFRHAIAALIVMLAAHPAAAEFSRIEQADQFRQAVTGKTLSRPLIRLKVTPDGAISGTGSRWAVTGNWVWRGGYFCRDLYWGGDALGYNCQEVRILGDRIRFTSDKGQGASAVFRLLPE